MCVTLLSKLTPSTLLPRAHIGIKFNSVVLALEKPNELHNNSPRY